MIIRAKDFRSWFRNNLKEYANDINNHGADAGYPCITYTSDTVKIFDKFADEIWDWAYEDAKEFGYSSVLAFVASFRRSDMTFSFDGFKNLLVWYACEKIAREYESEETHETL